MFLECSAAWGLPPGHLSRREFAKGEERQKSELLAIGAAKRRCWLVGGKTAKTKFVSTEAGVFGPKGGCAAVNVAQWQLRNAMPYWLFPWSSGQQGGNKDLGSNKKGKMVGVT